MALLHIGIDDTDSKEGMCTTYIGATIVDELKREGIELVGHPKLIRLNPNAPWKTRGNCAIALTVQVNDGEALKVKEIALKNVEKFAELKQRSTTPGVVFFEGEKIPRKLKAWSKRVVQDIVTIEDAERLAGELGAEVHKFKLGRGVIGALAAIGNPLERDRTYELVAYRTSENWGTPRKLDARSVEEMNAKTAPKTFDNLDPATGEIRITPHTPCPILYGIRAEDSETATEAHGMVKSEEPVEHHLLYMTNQGTDEHLVRAKIGEVEPLRSVIVDAEVIEPPRVITGGHIILRIRDGTGEIDCAAYEPTRQFRSIVKQLEVGDRIRAYGGAKRKPGLPLTINLEKLGVLKLVPVQRKVNPTCADCGRRMESAGKGKGYVCKRCKTKLPEKSARMVEEPRKLEVGTFEVPPRARRHLAKPLVRATQPRREY